MFLTHLPSSFNLLRIGLKRIINDTPIKYKQGFILTIHGKPHSCINISTKKLEISDDAFIKRHFMLF